MLGAVSTGRDCSFEVDADSSHSIRRWLDGGFSGTRAQHPDPLKSSGGAVGLP